LFSTESSQRDINDNNFTKWSIYFACWRTQTSFFRCEYDLII